MKPIDILTLAAANDEMSTDVFAHLTGIAVQTNGSEAFLSILHPDEVEWLRLRHGDSGFHQKGSRKGQPKMSLLPKAWQSSKSVLKNALDRNVPIAGRGKTEIERDPLYKGEKAESSKTPDDKAIESCLRITKLAREGLLSSEILNLIKHNIGEL